ncbi:MAG: hypothetical protein GYA35_09020 [Thermoanaerobaculaceae bacterium]|nr:hypothetical protein [Thermoanaerobaculaceae bacterium]
MVNKRIFLIVLSAIFITALLLFYPTEKRKIKNLMKKTAEWVQKSEEDTPLSIAVKSKKSRKFFADKVLLKIERRNYEREIPIEEIEKGYLYLMSSNSKFKVTIKDINIEIVDDFSAEADSAVIVETKGGTLEEFSNVNEVGFGLTKTEEGWRIRKIEIKEVLEK